MSVFPIHTFLKIKGSLTKHLIKINYYPLTENTNGYCKSQPVFMSLGNKKSFIIHISILIHPTPLSNSCPISGHCKNHEPFNSIHKIYNKLYFNY